jgi:CelD/BcsL family acetyltransferase involved in cellulose biosynthesis
MPHVIEVNQLAQLDVHRLAWRSLWQQTRYASFFQTLEWLECYWQHFGRQQRLHVLFLYSSGNLIGIMPLTEITETTRLGPIKVLTYPLHDWGSWYGPVGPNIAATLSATMKHLIRNRVTGTSWICAGSIRESTPDVPRPPCTWPAFRR